MVKQVAPKLSTDVAPTNEISWGERRVMRAAKNAEMPTKARIETIRDRLDGALMAQSSGNKLFMKTMPPN